MPSGFILSEGKISNYTSWREWATSKMANVGEDRMKPGIRILPLSSANDVAR